MYELASELAFANMEERLPVSVIRVWPSFPMEGSFLSMEAELEDGATFVRIDECGTGYKVTVSRWIFGDCWDHDGLGFAPTLLHAWKRVYEFLLGELGELSEPVLGMPAWASDEVDCVDFII